MVDEINKSHVRPIMHQIMARLEKYGLDRILERIEDGETLKSIAQDPEIQCGRSTLSRWLYGYYKSRGETKEQAEARKIAYFHARARQAMADVEDAKDIADKETDWHMAGVVRERVKIRTWTAERWNRQIFGNQPQTVQIHIGQLHLNALRHREVPDGGLEYAVEAGEVETDDLPQYLEVDARGLPAETGGSDLSGGSPEEESERAQDPESPKETAPQNGAGSDGVA